MGSLGKTVVEAVLAVAIGGVVSDLSSSAIRVIKYK